MKFLFVLLLTCIISNFAFSQSDSTRTYSGIVIDSSKNEPLEYVTIVLLDSDEKTQLKSTLTGRDGSFKLTVKSTKKSKLALSSIGYKSLIIQLDINKTDLGRILLASGGKELNEVVVTAARPIVKQEVDRISYNVQNDPDSKLVTALDMMRKVPLLSVDGQDNIKLKGNTNFKILINGRESALIAQNPADVFKSMPASNIEKIEVITTPPAKYDAEGLAGIINVITKKNMDQGYSGSVNTRYNTNGGPGINLNTTVKYKKIGMSSFGGLNNRHNMTTSFANTNVILRPIASSLTQSGLTTRGGNHAYGNAELSYDFDTLNLITGNINHYSGNRKEDSEQFSRELNADDSQAHYYQMSNLNRFNYRGTDYGINYQLGFRKNKEQLLTASYKYKLQSNVQNTHAAFLAKMDFPTTDYKQFNNSGSKEQTAQIDFVQPFKALTFEAGVKSILRNNFSDFENHNYDQTKSEFIIDTKRSNGFDYYQNVYSAYNSYQYKLDNWVAKGGVRFEYTTIDAEFGANATIDGESYANVVPSLSMQRTLNSKSNLTFGYSQRIQRPGIWQLNPFVDDSNPRFLRTGNPNLKPVTNRSFELKYSNFAKGSINLGLTYSFANNTVEYLLTTENNITTRTFANAGKNGRLSLDGNINYTIKKFTTSINSSFVHVSLTGRYNNEEYSNSGFQGYIFTNSTYKIKPTFNIGFNIGYDSRYVMLQGRDNDYFYYEVSGSKDILNKKGSISFGLNNPFNKYQNLDFYNSNSDFRQANNFDVIARQATVSFNYKFGKLNGGIKKNKRGINNDDVGGNGR